MGRLVDAVVEFIEDRRWPVEVDDGLIRTAIRTGDQILTVAVVAVEEAGQLVVYCVHPDEVPTGRRSEVSELVNRINSSLTVGNLEIDLDDGQVRFRTGLGVGQGPVTHELVERVILDNAASALACFPQVDAVMRGEATAVEAAEAVSGG